MINVLTGEEQEYFATKVCGICGVEKPLDQFPKHIHHEDNLDSRCRTCIKRVARHRAKLKKNAPPKPPTCDCCGKVLTVWVLDHDYVTDLMRGWICDDCNVGMGKLGDDLDGARKAVAYLERFEKKVSTVASSGIGAVC